MIKLSEIMLFSDNFVQAYEKMCQLLCREFQIPQTAFDILMFLSNNPQYHTASDIVHLRKIKPNLVSFHVEKLVREGLLERRSLPDDRRKVMLYCTPRAETIATRGRKIQQEFFHAVTADISEEDLRICMNTINRIGGNAEKLNQK
jgi:DNA-binding MarR family transcriptional regulator